MLVRLESLDDNVVYVSAAHVIGVQDDGGVTCVMLLGTARPLGVKGTADEVARLLGYTGSVT